MQGTYLLSLRVEETQVKSLAFFREDIQTVHIAVDDDREAVAAISLFPVQVAVMMAGIWMRQIL